MARQIQGAEATRALYDTFICPPPKDYKWVICSNQIKNCPVTVKDVDVSQKLWEKDSSVLKGKITRRKQNLVARDKVKIPVNLMKLHKEVFLICDIFV